MTLAHVTGKEVLRYLNLSIEELNDEVIILKIQIADGFLSRGKFYSPETELSKIEHIEKVIAFKNK